MERSLGPTAAIQTDWVSLSYELCPGCDSKGRGRGGSHSEPHESQMETGHSWDGGKAAATTSVLCNWLMVDILRSTEN